MKKLHFLPDAQARQTRPGPPAQPKPATPGTTPAIQLIAGLRPGSRVAVKGMIRSPEAVTVGDRPAYHFTLVDGSGELDVLFLGGSRPRVLRPGTRITAEGTVGSYYGQLAVEPAICDRAERLRACARAARRYLGACPRSSGAVHRCGCFTDQVRSIRLETVIAAPAGDCFNLSLSVDAHAASMRASGEQAIGGVTSGVMTLGDSVTWRARHFGIAFRMTSAITEYRPPSRFVDEQQHGPFRRWWHEHTFTALPDGQTQMTDVVEFQSPLGLLGRVADGLVLGHYMPHLLRQRNAWLKTTLEQRG